MNILFTLNSTKNISDLTRKAIQLPKSKSNGRERERGARVGQSRVCVRSRSREGRNVGSWLSASHEERP